MSFSVAFFVPIHKASNRIQGYRVLSSFPRGSSFALIHSSDELSWFTWLLPPTCEILSQTFVLVPCISTQWQ